MHGFHYKFLLLLVSLLESFMLAYNWFSLFSIIVLLLFNLVFLLFARYNGGLNFFVIDSAFLNSC